MHVDENEADDRDFIPKPLWYVTGSTQNEVWYAGAAFYEAAAVMFHREEEQTGCFWAKQKWHVIHHLSFIACELFIRAMTTKEQHVEADQDGYAEITRVCAPKDRRHSLWPDYFAESRAILEERLRPDELVLLQQTADGMDELSRGRYPYEWIGDGKANGKREPLGVPDRGDAVRWLALARSLRNIC